MVGKQHICVNCVCVLHALGICVSVSASAWERLLNFNKNFLTKEEIDKYYVKLSKRMNEIKKHRHPS